MTKITTFAAVAITGILSIGSALADANHTGIAASQFAPATVTVQTSVGSTGATASTTRQAAQPADWAPIALGDAGGH
jgi:hypothetical protein